MLYPSALMDLLVRRQFPRCCFPEFLAGQREAVDAIRGERLQFKPVLLC